MGYIFYSNSCFSKKENSLFALKLKKAPSIKRSAFLVWIFSCLLSELSLEFFYISSFLAALELEYFNKTKTLKTIGSADHPILKDWISCHLKDKACQKSQEMIPAYAGQGLNLKNVVIAKALLFPA
jgi:hypothetical protein